MTPSNANTSGLEVVAWRWREKGTPMDWRFEGDVPNHQDLRWNEAEPLVTAASAQARIAELESEIAALVRRRDDLLDTTNRYQARYRAAEARDNRLAKALEPFSEGARMAEISGRPPSEFCDASDYQDARAALQQEG